MPQHRQPSAVSMAETAMKGLSGSLENLSMSLSLYGDLDDDENEYAQP
jgi:hypothetical protein